MCAFQLCLHALSFLQPLSSESTFLRLGTPIFGEIQRKIDLLPKKEEKSGFIISHPGRRLNCAPAHVFVGGMRTTQEKMRIKNPTEESSSRAAPAIRATRLSLRRGRRAPRGPSTPPGGRSCPHPSSEAAGAILPRSVLLCVEFFGGPDGAL